MKKKIFKYYIVLFVCVLFFTAFFTSTLSSRFYRLEVENKLISITASIEHYVLNIAKYEELDYDFISKNFANNINKTENYFGFNDNIRVTFVNFDGIVLGDSEADHNKMENHGQRKEIKLAMEKGFGKDIRKSRTINTDLLYVAVPLNELSAIARISVPLTQIKEINKLIWLYTILATLAAIILTIIVSIKISNSLIKPFSELIIASKEISNGNYTGRIKLKSKDELGQLSNSFNEMAEKLENTINDLWYKKVEIESIVDSMTIGIVAVDTMYRVVLINPVAIDLFGVDRGKDIIGNNIVEHIRNNQVNVILRDTIYNNKSFESDYISMNDKILKLSTSPIKPKSEDSKNSGAIVFIQDITKIRKLEKIRTEFVSNVTHELKTPITSIRGFIETLKGGAISNQQVSMRFLDIIDIEAERLHALIDDILQLSEIESRQNAPKIEKIDIKETVNDVAEVMQNIAQERNVTVYNDVDEGLTINADKNRLKQLLLNLIDNAIKYNVQDGTVKIKAYRSEGKVVIIVKDTGIGIDSEHFSRIFERFYRVDKGRSRDQGGTGLGLSIVKHIVNLFSGDIKVNSKLGEGSEFIIQLPI